MTNGLFLFLEGLSSTTIVQIEVEDKNDNAPVFYPSVYNVSLRQDVSPGLPLLIVSATDADDGVYGQVTYRISAGDQGGLFRIDPKRGTVTQEYGSQILKIISRV